jgi:hypothetical protein
LVTNEYFRENAEKNRMGDCWSDASSGAASGSSSPGGKRLQAAAAL